MDDTTKLQQRVLELEESERKLKLELDDLTDFVENAALPLHWINGSGIIIWANQAELKLLGYEKDEYINQHISKIHADKDVIENILGSVASKV